MSGFNLFEMFFRAVYVIKVLCVFNLILGN